MAVVSVGSLTRSLAFIGRSQSVLAPNQRSKLFGWLTDGEKRNQVVSDAVLSLWR